MGKLEQVVGLLKESLEDEDTYVYLAAINGLVACARSAINQFCKRNLGSWNVSMR